MGISRSATVVIAYLIATSQMTPHEALAAVRAKRAIVRPNRGFMQQLHEYHSRIHDDESLQGEVIEKPPLDEKSEAKNHRKGGKQRRSHSTRRSGDAAKGVYSAFAALTLSSATTPLERFGGHEHWKLELEHRIS